jgi:photosystem II stability/assembly factor-like uncharacterized protein
VVVVGRGIAFYSIDGTNWHDSRQSVGNPWTSVTYGGGKFVATGFSSVGMYSNDGNIWHSSTIPFLSTSPSSVTYGAGRFVAVQSYGVVYSDDGITWKTTDEPQFGYWIAVTYGGGKFVALSYGFSGQHMNTMSSFDGNIWDPTHSGPIVGLTSLTYGGGIFVAAGYNAIVLSDNGINWRNANSPQPTYGMSVTYGGGIFVIVGGDKITYSSNGDDWFVANTPYIVYDTDLMSVTYGKTNGVDMFTAIPRISDFSVLHSINGIDWYNTPPIVNGDDTISITYGKILYTPNNSDLVYSDVSPLTVISTSSHFAFSSDVYSSMSFGSPVDAAFWGFDYRNGLTYSFPITTPWTYIQSGWTPGFLPPSLSTWDDSVAHKLCKAVRIMLGKQTIKEYSGEYIELLNDLTVSYENKAVLKLMNGTLDQTQATVSREYYTTLPLGTKEIPLCALTHQQMSVEVDFEAFRNLSQNLNPGTGDFLDSKSYFVYNASTGILNGRPINVQTTLSYQQYIFIITYEGNFIIYDTTKPVDSSDAYIVITGFTGSTGLFSQFCILGGTIYIQLVKGYVVKGIVNKLVQGNVSSFESNDYLPGPVDDIGPPTGTMVADARYIYYAQSNLAQSNVFMTRYDTQTPFQSSVGYTSFDFTSNINSSVTSIYQMISTGDKIIALTNTPFKFYTFYLNRNFTFWDYTDYSLVAYQITNGVLIGKTVYFIGDGYTIISYEDNIFKRYDKSTFVALDNNTAKYSVDNGVSWISGGSVVNNNSQYVDIAFGNGTFVMVGLDNRITYSDDYGLSWHPAAVIPIVPYTYFFSVAYGNGTFVASSESLVYSTDNGRTWHESAYTGPDDTWHIAFGNETFVGVGYHNMISSIDYGRTWQNGDLVLNGFSRIAFGNGTFVVTSDNGDSFYSTDNGITWTQGDHIGGSYYAGLKQIAFGNGTFIVYDTDGPYYSIDNGLTWLKGNGTYYQRAQSQIAFGNGTFVIFVLDYPYNLFLSNDNGRKWTPSPTQFSSSVGSAASTNFLMNLGSGLENLHAFGSKIYASSNSYVIEIDTTQDLSSSLAYKYYSSTTPNAPVVFDVTAPKIFANGSRYLYIFTNDPSQMTTPTNITRFDTYTQSQILQTSIIADYKSLPDGVTKPDKALIGLIQTQKVTDMTQMDIHGPVKELWVTGMSDSANVFQYSNLATRSTLALAGERIVTDDDGTHTFLNVIEPFETHTSMPVRNVSVVSFEFDPESDLPNGTINFSRIRDQVFDGNAHTVWARNYNILAIQGGTGGLMFN